MIGKMQMYEVFQGIAMFFGIYELVKRENRAVPNF
jgi:hypothetical protein